MFAWFAPGIELMTGLDTGPIPSEKWICFVCFAAGIDFTTLFSTLKNRRVSCLQYVCMFGAGIEQPAPLHAVAATERGLHGRRLHPQGQAKTRL